VSFFFFSLRFTLQQGRAFVVRTRLPINPGSSAPIWGMEDGLREFFNFPCALPRTKKASSSLVSARLPARRRRSNHISIVKERSTHVTQIGLYVNRIQFVDTQQMLVREHETALSHMSEARTGRQFG
jgi:hypothetical protein